MNPQFKKGDDIEVAGEPYVIRGCIIFKNIDDNSQWVEYKLISSNTNKEMWLSVDDHYSEYGMYEVKHTQFSIPQIKSKGYTLADEGVAIVQGSFGDVDVSYGDEVVFEEYEFGNTIIAVEEWEDEKEYSRGVYINRDDIKLINSSATTTNTINNYNNNSGSKVIKFIVCFIGLFMAVPLLFSILPTSNNAILKFLEKSSSFAYITSLTSDTYKKEKAQVFKTSLSIGDASKQIISAIKGNTVDVQNSDEDNSIAILTTKEYCYVYLDETTKETYVQVSQRLYAYSSNNYIYRGSRLSNNFYRRYYYSRAYNDDSTSYKKYASAFDDFSGNPVTNNTQNEYNQYSNTIRQNSVRSRSSSGGGTSSGK